MIVALAFLLNVLFRRRKSRVSAIIDNLVTRVQIFIQCGGMVPRLKTDAIPTATIGIQERVKAAVEESKNTEQDLLTGMVLLRLSIFIRNFTLKITVIVYGARKPAITQKMIYDWFPKLGLKSLIQWTSPSNLVKSDHPNNGHDDNITANNQLPAVMIFKLCVGNTSNSRNV